ncbi:dihydrofolate reductase [Flavobacteriales bacterium]|nr:dihydrofolate reductase [Flavobacteriales bacterium]
MVSIVVATAQNNVIGNDNDLIWHLPADLKHFKSVTSGSSIVMGRKTYESIGRPLPKRENIIITRQTGLLIEGCVVVNSLQEAINKAESEEVFIIGGGEIYKQAMEIADKIYLTKIHQDFEGDTMFPEIDPNVWKELSCVSGELDEKNKLKHSFLELVRR